MEIFYNERGKRIMSEALHHVLYAAVDGGILVFEIIGVALLFWAGMKGFAAVVRKNLHAGLILGEGIALALQFLLAGEIPDRATLVGGSIILLGVLLFNFGGFLFQQKKY